MFFKSLFVLYFLIFEILILSMDVKLILEPLFPTCCFSVSLAVDIAAGERGAGTNYNQVGSKAFSQE